MTLTPWVARNAQLVDQPILSTTFTDNFNYVSAVATLLYVDGKKSYPFSAEWDDIYYGEIVAVAGAKYGPFPDVYTAADAYLQLNYVSAVARQIVEEHPKAFLLAHSTGVRHAWSVHEHYTWYTVLSGRSWGDFPIQNSRYLGQFLHGFWWAIRFCTVLSFAIAFKHYPSLRPYILWVIALSFMLTFVAGPLASFRFRFPVEPSIALFIAVGFSAILKQIKRVANTIFTVQK